MQTTDSAAMIAEPRDTPIGLESQPAAPCRVSIIVVTYFREDFLGRTVRSCLAQRGIHRADLEIIVVDGSPGATARGVVDDLMAEAAQAGVALRFVHDPRRGISHSRNSGVAAARAPLVAFIDDDEEADPDWLARMLDCRERYGADILVGPVYPRFELESARRDPFWNWYFTVDRKLPSGAEALRGGGTHNCLFLKRTCCLSAEPFDPAFGLTGGEDSRFFLGVARRGGRLLWCADGAIHEFIPASRTALRYALRRRFRENQLMMQSFTWADAPDIAGLAFWMGVGLAQMLSYAPAALLLWAIDRTRARICLVKAVGGAGKLIWMKRLTLIGYGGGAAASALSPSRG
jgi:glycosyltransferase involved in cell wall biosynthesis